MFFSIVFIKGEWLVLQTFVVASSLEFSACVPRVFRDHRHSNDGAVPPDILLLLLLLMVVLIVILMGSRIRLVRLTRLDLRAQRRSKYF